jgi:RHS repeat-associated protein
MAWLETYTYDRNGNRAAKATPWGTIRYGYDAENRLLRKGDIVYTNDRNGNTLRERGLRYEAIYEYNGQNRMVYSEITSHIDRTHTVGSYAYDALGRRTLTESVTGQTLRTLYDGKGFEAVREGEAFRDGSLTTRFAAGSVAADGNGVMRSNQPTGERYRWLSDGSSGRIVGEDGYAVEGSRYGGRGVTLYGKGEAVAVNYSSGNGSRSTYLGKDILGSVRTATTDTGAVEDRYEYDAFGTVYQGDLSGGMNLGYTGKPYEMATGLYNYGYRDYKPQAARFTTVDPIRDGNNWFAYVNNDPVNYIDLWGLNDVRLTIFNFDPTPGLNEIVDQNGIAGHTWLGFDGLDYLGVGFYGDDSRPINQTSQVPLALLSDWDSNAPDNRQPTNDYTITITDAQAGMIKDYLNGMTDPNSSSYTPYYNLGGKYNEPNSTMCTEAVIDALNYAGVLNPLESYIVTDYKKWEESYPIPIPGVLEPRKNEFMNLTAPNPNAFEYRIKQLEATRDILNDFDYSSYVNRKKGQ